MTTPTPNFLGTHVRRGRPRGVARLRRRFEHVCDLCPYNAGVGGSNPSPPTTRKRRPTAIFGQRPVKCCSLEDKIPGHRPVSCYLSGKRPDKGGCAWGKRRVRCPKCSSLDTKRNGRASAAPAGLSGPLQPLQRFLCNTCRAA